MDQEARGTSLNQTSEAPLIAAQVSLDEISAFPSFVQLIFFFLFIFVVVVLVKYFRRQWGFFSLITRHSRQKFFNKDHYVFKNHQNGALSSSSTVPPSVSLFVTYLLQSGKSHQAFLHLADAEPLRRQEILSSWIESSAEFSEIDCDELKKFLCHENAFEKVLELLNARRSRALGLVS